MQQYTVFEKGKDALALLPERRVRLQRECGIGGILDKKATVIGAGLAGCEAAWTLAKFGYKVTLAEMKPKKRSPAHSSDMFSELVCSNSFKSDKITTASGLLKEEMRIMGSLLLEVAETCRVSAGGALAVDRNLFSERVTERILSNKNISVICKEVTSIDTKRPSIIAAGPLTEGEFARALSEKTGGFLSFYDAASPVLTAESIDFDRVFFADRYDYSGKGDYLNCYFNKIEYENFQSELMSAKTVEKAEFEKDKKLYEGCVPIEMLAKRGVDTMRYGPLRPVGLVDPKTGKRPWAAVQLRKEDLNGNLYNMVGFQTNLLFGEQKRIFRMIPGLENAEFARYGVMHRNSFLHSPKVLNKNLSIVKNDNIFVAGQLTGVEGYMASAMTGMVAARNLILSDSEKTVFIPSNKTMSGALIDYITTENDSFQPMGANMGLIQPENCEFKNKEQKRLFISKTAVKKMTEYVNDYRKLI